ncbi:cupin domain-containing protein [Fulvivirgaceae bacterium PWU20]|uniref:Cupin domain-containing protein n=2 Tax=Chryseosolibacter indicus TaxID=2782351 RepID=A0ABS5VXA9_9BACT|nr:cupin domain-containing protein [Chryseosolibacter indicus]
MKSASYWVELLQLTPHPEGGFFKETYRSSEVAGKECLSDGFTGKRNFSTAIYFLLRSQDRSLFHRIKSDEMWHYYAGGSLTLYVLNEGGLRTYKLGTSLENGESVQIVIPANSWFGAKVNEADNYVLCGCTVSPGFDFEDFEMASREELLKAFPFEREVIELLTQPT